MRKKSKISAVLVSALVLGSSLAFPVSACDLTKSELIEKYGYLCNVSYNKSALVLNGAQPHDCYIAYERKDSAEYLPSTGSVIETGTEGALSYALLDNGNARITSCDFAALPADTVSISIPAEIGGCPVTEIGYRAFCRAGETLTQLRTITVPDTVEIIGERAFSRAFGFQSEQAAALSREEKAPYSITLPANVKYIGYRAFFGSVFAVVNGQGNDNLLELPESLEYISSQAFDMEVGSRVYNHIEVKMPKSLVFMSDDTFHTDLRWRGIDYARSVRAEISLNTTDIPTEDIPMLLSVVGNGFYQNEKNIISMTDLLWDYLDTEVPDIDDYQRVFGVERDSDFFYGVHFEDCPATIEGIREAAKQNAPDLYPGNADTTVRVLPLIVGDINNDGFVNLDDARDALTYYNLSFADVENTNLSGDALTAADVTGNGTVDLDDAIAIMQYYNLNDVADMPTPWGEIVK